MAALTYSAFHWARGFTPFSRKTSAPYAFFQNANDPREVSRHRLAHVFLAAQRDDVRERPSWLNVFLAEFSMECAEYQISLLFGEWKSQVRYFGGFHNTMMASENSQFQTGTHA